MGRLFWKFFFFVWFAQLTTILGVTAFFWWRDQQAPIHQESRQGPGSPGTSVMGNGKPLRPAGEAMVSWAPNHRRPPPPVEPLVGGLLASLLFALLLARHFSKPIRTLRGAFGSVASGNLDFRLGKAMGRRKDELADLAQDFDAMAARLQILVDGHRRLLHDASHELRSPLSRLKTSIGICRQQPAELENSIQHLEQETVQMEMLLEDLLTLSRLEAGVSGRRIEQLEVMDFLARVIGAARCEAAARHIQVELIGRCAGAIDGDGELLQRAVGNVVRNAVRHSVPGSTVIVTACIQEDTCELWLVVKDDGPGVPESDLEAIFLPFHQGIRAGAGNGLGLSLAVAKRILESNGGRISGANRAEGGFCMEVFLPARGTWW